MPPTYLINYTLTTKGQIEVEADDEASAESWIEDMNNEELLANHTAAEQEDSELEISSIEKLDGDEYEFS